MNSSNLVFPNWTLELIRNDDEAVALSWLEEKRFDWCNIAYRFINQIINGYSVIICTDSKREWFLKYALHNINLNKGRPLIPIFDIKNILPNVEISTHYIEDMLDLAFKNHTIWYVGRDDNKLSTLAIEHPNSFIWAFDSNRHAAFNLSSNDVNADIKLLQLFSVLDRSIDALMFNEIVIE